MSFKSSPSDEFLETFRKHNSQDSDRVDVAYGCWVDLKEQLEKRYTSAVKARKSLRAALRECRTELKTLQDSER